MLKLNFLTVSHTDQIATNLTFFKNKLAFFYHMELCQRIVTGMTYATAPLTLHIVNDLVRIVSALNLDGGLLENFHVNGIKVKIDLGRF